MSKGQYIGYCRYCKQQTMLQIDDVVAADYENNPEEWEAYLEEEATKNVSARVHLPGGMLKEEYATQKTGA